MSKSNRFTSSSSGNSNSGNSNSGNRSNNSRFSVLNDPVEPKVNSPKEPRSNALFSNRMNNNSRFASLKEEPLIESTSDNGNDSNRSTSDNRSNRSYSSFKTTVPVKKPEPVMQQMNLKETDFPDLISISAIKKEESANKWAEIVKKEVVVEIKETDEDKLPKIAPGWICIRKNPKTGKQETIQGPLTEEQKQYDRLKYLEQHDFKYNMLKTIERMEARWDDYKEQYDERYGQGAYNEKYGIHQSDDNDNYDDYDDENESDSDSEYEYVYE